MPKGAKVFGIIFDIFVYLLATAIIIGAILFAFNTSADKALFGYRYYTVLTGSMEPTYKVGDMIFVKLTDGDSINVGDVITFNPSQDSDAYLTHRVVEKFENYEGTDVTCFKTRGDANNAEDSFLIDESRVIGVVKFGIPVLGYIVRFIQLRWYIIVPVLIMIGAFFLLLKRYFLIGKDDEDEKNGKPALADGELNEAVKPTDNGTEDDPRDNKNPEPEGPSGSSDACRKTFP